MRRKLKNRKCEYCKLVFRPRRNEQIFCSRKCAGLSRQCRVVIECAYCQKKSERPLNKALKPKSRLNFCNRDCKERAQRIGGISAIHPDHYGTANGRYGYRTKALKDLPNYCNKCGYFEYTKMLDVHHKDGDRENNAIENLEILCVWCHALNTRNIVEFHFPGG